MAINKKIFLFLYSAVFIFNENAFCNEPLLQEKELKTEINKNKRKTIKKPGNNVKKIGIKNAESFNAKTCKVDISPNEDRSIIILKLQQRMDCLEINIDYINKLLQSTIKNRSLYIPKNNE